MINDPELQTRPHDLAELKELAGIRRPPVVAALGALHRHRGLMGKPPYGQNSPRTNTQRRGLTAEALALPPDELQTWAEIAARLDAGQVVAVASLAGVPASEIFKLVEVLLNYV